MGSLETKLEVTEERVAPSEPPRMVSNVVGFLRRRSRMILALATLAVSAAVYYSNVFAYHSAMTDLRAGVPRNEIEVRSSEGIAGHLTRYGREQALSNYELFHQ